MFDLFGRFHPLRDEMNCWGESRFFFFFGEESELEALNLNDENEGHIPLFLVTQVEGFESWPIPKAKKRLSAKLIYEAISGI